MHLIPSPALTERQPPTHGTSSLEVGEGEGRKGGGRGKGGEGGEGGEGGREGGREDRRKER